ncbi:MAG: SAM-dependent DNA methyltransferase, partial [Candidatus Eisenbacteria sp.]|nr:SAM-dependent DNA methyltransferase [Candidatus Eisenbacteria bacterium]
QQELRNHLRARARQLGDRQDSRSRLSIDHIVNECAYENWHRMLFARFLAENHLLIEPEMGVAISLAEAEELAKEEGSDLWVFASRCAQRMLPQIFRPDDPLLQVSFATEHMLKLEGLLASLQSSVFTASDALGWVYQFWQSKKKDEVNRSEVKIGADELPAVTQLFTEPYMVEFLIHNTLGAWWAGKNLNAEDAENAETEEELRKKLALPGINWEYLRLVREENGDWLKRRAKPEDVPVPDFPTHDDQAPATEHLGPWRPAAGTFDGWPKAAKDIKVLDPCCGSGHFLVAALHHLVPIRMAEEGLSAREAIDAVLRDNIHGLEIDERCCQIAAFALAFAAWTYPNLPSPSGRGAGGEGVCALGYRPLPDLHIACTGIGPQATQEQWLNLAEQSGMPTATDERTRIKNGLLNLHRLFSQAPTLGSLINPAGLRGDVFAADYVTIQPYLAAILKAEKADDEIRERVIAAAGMVKAADLLAGKYTLVITNVPYLGRVKHGEALKAWLGSQYPRSKSDLAACFVERCLGFCAASGTTAALTPQTWFYQAAYKKARVHLLLHLAWHFVARLGEGGFSSQAAAGAFTAMIVLSKGAPPNDWSFAGLDASQERDPAGKGRALSDRHTERLLQSEQIRNPDHKVTLRAHSSSVRLTEYCSCYLGLGTGDYAHYGRVFWEFQDCSEDWALHQSTVEKPCLYGGRCNVVAWDPTINRVRGMSPTEREQIHNQDQTGQQAWGKPGVAVGLMRELKPTLYTGEKFEKMLGVLLPRDPTIIPALWAYVSSQDFGKSVRELDNGIVVANATLAKVPFDLAHWQEVAAEKYPDDLPEPESDDPTQWLFHGRPEESTAPLQVAVARLLGYGWPAELDEEMRLSQRARELVKQCGELLKFADSDGIVCIPSVRGEEPAAGRLLGLLTACDVEMGGDPEDWLRNDFSEEHCKLFHNRPFIWHIWDGRKRDGFHALVNYHKLCEGGGKGRKLLESLTYSYLGWWINRQKDEVKRGEGGAEDRLAAAMELQKRLIAILAGEPPFDIFVRWKPLSEQAIGWEPDSNDGVRMNIRPFLSSDLPKGVCSGARKGAGILRHKPNIKWTKDRGKEPERPKAEYPWFWGWDEKTEDFMGTGKKPDGNRWNGLHYTNKVKQKARERPTTEGAESRRGETQ